jgi:hypothetical protein
VLPLEVSIDRAFLFFRIGGSAQKREQHQNKNVAINIAKQWQKAMIKAHLKICGTGSGQLAVSRSPVFNNNNHSYSYSFNSNLLSGLTRGDFLALRQK